MKNFAKITALVIVLTLCLFSTVSFAISNQNYKYTMTGELSTNSVAAGDTVTLTIYVHENGGNVALGANANGGVTPSITYPLSVLDYTSNEIKLGTAYEISLSDDGMDTEGYIDGTITIKTGATLNKTTPIVVYTFTAKAAADNLADLFYFYEDATGMNDNVAAGLMNTEITVAAPPVTNYTVAYDLAGGNGTAEGGEVEEGTEITLPAAPTKAGYTFKGWNDGTTTYAAGASYTVNANVTFTAEWEEVVVADPTVETATVSEGYTTVAGTNGTIYNNVWVGEYSATPETGAALTSMTVSFKDGAKVFNVADHKTVEGEATLEFSIALIGVPTSENLAGTVAATAAWVN